MRAILACLAVCVLAACALVPEPTTPEELAYLERVMACPLTFVIPANETELTWGRIQGFLGKYSSMKIQTVTEYVIETYNPVESEVDFGYSIVRTPVEEGVEIAIRCVTGNMFCRREADLNAHILAHYARTGEIIPKFITI